MKKQMRTYSEAFKEQAVSLLRSSGRSAADIERELGITPGLLSRWNRLQAKAAGEVIAPRSNCPYRFSKAFVFRIFEPFWL